MVRDPATPAELAFKQLGQAIAGAKSEQIIRTVEVIESLADRGAADQLLAPVRDQLRVLKPARSLRFSRVMLYPLEPLIVTPAEYRPGEPALPRNWLVRMAQQVHEWLGDKAAVIEAEIAGKKSDDFEAIRRIGRTVWPIAAQILADHPVSDAQLPNAAAEKLYRKLVEVTSVLLAEAPALEPVVAETANGLLPPRKEAISAIIRRIASVNATALPLFMVLLLTRLPQAVATLENLFPGQSGVQVREARDKAAEMLLRRLHAQAGTENEIEAGSLTDAGTAANRIIILLDQLGSNDARKDWREPIRAVRRRLDGACRTRFAAGLERTVMAPLQRDGQQPGSAAIASLESNARSLRALETAARPAGGGATYDRMLHEAAETIGTLPVTEHLTPVDRARLVEILVGSEAALAVLKKPL